MSSKVNEVYSSITNLREDFVSYMILVMILLIIITIASYIYYIINLNKSECNFINNLYPDVNGNIVPISEGVPDLSGNLYDYYIKTAYNACSGGSYKNDVVDICNLKAVIKQGVRCLDFEIYSVDNEPVVSSSTSDNYYVKETFNSVNFSSVMKTIVDYAMANPGTTSSTSSLSCPNQSDPLIIHLRIKSNNQKMYSKLADIFGNYDKYMLTGGYSYENNNTNLGGLPLLQFRNKIILIVDKINTAFLENTDFMEYVNLTSNSVFMRAHQYFDVKNTPDMRDLTEFNKLNMTIVFPDKGVNPVNPSGIVCRTMGCQMVAMRYQYVDNFLEENTLLFDKCGFAFCLKPESLRNKVVTVEAPPEQDPNLSYATRNITTNFYSFDI
jgi:hypothetical protein